MNETSRSGPIDPDRDTHTDDIDLSAIAGGGLTQSYGAAPAQSSSAAGRAGAEANVILIAHPEGKHLGTRYRLGPGEVLEIGRSPELRVSLPDVPSVSRLHARLAHCEEAVTLEDLGSTNGTYVNGRMVLGPERLRSGDRFQVGAAHFKFLHEMDVEHAYYEAIYDLVTRDGLTDVHNRRKYQDEVEREFARARRHGRPLSLILLDLDAFKEINDQCGHLCGDFVLKRVTLVTAELLRPEQTFARLGGDEFAVLSPETDVAGAQELAEKVRARVADLDYRYAGHPVAISCSLGVAGLDRTMGKPDDLYLAADRALYRSKQAGGNRVTVAGE
jgi:diguanylate cyclase (GGDEF)-like protein